MAILRTLARAFVLFVMLFGLMQLARPERTNPPIDPSLTLAAHVAVPPPVAAILDRSCRDCHTHQTTWPWYSRVAPASWLVVHDVNEGRDHLNLSTWATQGDEDRRESLSDICKEVRRGNMPVKPYLLMHREAALTPGDVDTLCAWTDATTAALRAEKK